jgi:electron transfer flavoprotein beta subunit
LKLIVFIKSVLDADIPIECENATDRIKPDWNISILNPDDETAIATALKIKRQNRDTHITVVHLGPPSNERFVREAVSLGCDEGLRIWDEGLDDIRTAAKALIFSRVARILGFDLILTGSRSLDANTGQLAILLASNLQIQFITRATDVDKVDSSTVLATRSMDYGYRQRIECLKPLVVAVESGEESSLQASFQSVAEASEMKIQCFDLSEIGIPRTAFQKADSPLRFEPIRFPVPKQQFIESPDSSLSAFLRRSRLEKGGDEKRKGNIAQCDPESAAKRIFQTLLREGWLDHLRKEKQKA